MGIPKPKSGFGFVLLAGRVAAVVLGFRAVGVEVALVVVAHVFAAHRLVIAAVVTRPESFVFPLLVPIVGRSDAIVFDVAVLVRARARVLERFLGCVAALLSHGCASTSRIRNDDASGVDTRTLCVRAGFSWTRQLK